MTEHEIHAENLAAYALDALDPASARELESHLAGCAECSAKLLELESARDVLGASVVQVEPPRALKRRIMSEAKADLRMNARRVATTRPIRQRWGLQVATGFAVVAVIGGALIVGPGDGDEEPVRIAAQPTTTAPAEKIEVTLEREGDAGELRVDRLPALARGRAYQLWIQRGQELRPSTVFTLEPDGTAVAAVDGSLADADAVVLTREPSAGSSEPSSLPLLRVPLEES